RNGASSCPEVIDHEATADRRGPLAAALFRLAAVPAARARDRSGGASPCSPSIARWHGILARRSAERRGPASGASVQLSRSPNSEATALAVPLPSVQQPQFPRSVLSDRARFARSPCDPGDPLQRPNAPIARPRAIPRPVRVAPVDRRHHVLAV